MILVLGGLKSGKSRFASSLASHRKGKVVYLATALAGDDEMRERIRRHREERPSEWLTVEEPVDPARVFLSDAVSGVSTVVVECLTLWLTNILSPLGDEPDRNEAMRLGEREAGRLLEVLKQWEHGAMGKARQTLVLSNQVETGLISTWPLGRVFQDLAGITHQRFAFQAEEVYMMNAGIPQKLK